LGFFYVNYSPLFFHDSPELLINMPKRCYWHF